MSAVRCRLVAELSKELMGPRGGRTELLDVDPSGEYLVGVLEPKDSVRGDFQYYGTADVLENVSNGMEEEEQVEEDERVDRTQTSFGLQFGLPKTVGISFVAHGQPPLVSFCATWARYTREGDKWLRNPRFFVKEKIDATKPDEWSSPDDTVKFVLRTHISVDGNHHVALYMVNETPLGDPEKVRTEDLIFQPQLRIVKEQKTELIPMIGEQLNDEEEASLSLLYRNRRGLARGHLCSAVWSGIDPERQISPLEALRPKSHPFLWIDAETVKEDAQRTKFLASDVRTEFIPSYSIEQRPLEKLTGAEEYNTENLAEAWESGRLIEYFEPLLSQYAIWIQAQIKSNEDLPPEYREIGKRHLDLCERSRQRIQEGLTILRNNEEARLAFCFMNKAMQIQSEWKQPNIKLVWRPFQIAFILQCIPSIVDPNHKGRMTCDLLWFPTGGGKTEAYLGLAVFTMALRRRMRHDEEDGGMGTTVISRYTLRLLTIQQFRRALYAILACDFLRVLNWHPGQCEIEQPNIWGGARFSIGLWVGADVTPNRLLDRRYKRRFSKKEEVSLGATGLLLSPDVYKNDYCRVPSKGRPAQILNCPACDTVLAITKTNINSEKDYWLHWLIFSPNQPKLDKTAIDASFLIIKGVLVKPMPSGNYYVISIKLRPKREITKEDIDQWWNDKVKPALGSGVRGEFSRPSFPGYFIKRWDVSRTPIDFEIHCVNPKCPLNGTQWSEHMPAVPEFSEAAVLKPFRVLGKPGVSWSIPIAAYVIDDQVYNRCPSMVISTVDKFARLSFEPRAAAIFGNVDHFDDGWGYYRECAPPDRGDLPEGKTTKITRFKPPDLIIQDELHLIEGPLGTMVGLYETAIDTLSTDYSGAIATKPKYVASSATIRRARFQVSAVFDRVTEQFPSPGISIEDNFFSQTFEPHQLDGQRPGRLYVGICVPGKGPLRPVSRIWATLLQEVYRLKNSGGFDERELDQFWTIIGFFNALRELAITQDLYRHDVLTWIDVICARARARGIKANPRPLSHVEKELSSRIGSEEIPEALNVLAKFPDNDVDAVLATSMFGTGVDIDRLGLMVVHGQPKTTATYIQATGRVGRRMGGLVVTFLRATRPRDLDHYEFFAGYHRSLARYVEPITVHPFSPAARDRALGPMSVAILRNAQDVLAIPVNPIWAIDNDHDFRVKTPADVGPTRMRTQKRSKEVESVMKTIETRSQQQPKSIRPKAGTCLKEIDSDIDRWKSHAADDELVYYEQSMTHTPKFPVVLGDAQHKAKKKRVVFENAPQSLREVESSATFGCG